MISRAIRSVHLNDVGPSRLQRPVFRGKRAYSSGMPVLGTVAPGFEAIRDAFATGQSIDVGGAQLAVYRRGAKVVDLWTGDDPVRGRPFDGDGIAVFMSVTKGLTATVAHLLAQRGLLDYTAPVSQYWPEFAQNGKDKITVRMILTHSAGLPAFPAEAKIQGREMANYLKVVRCLEEMVPFWEPGTQFLYSPWTFGFLVGEIVRRITGKTIGTVLHEEIAGPLNLDLWIGLPEDQEPRLIPVLSKTIQKHLPRKSEKVRPSAPASTSNSKIDVSNHRLVAAYNAAFGRPVMLAFLSSREGHACELPAGNGVGDARSLAKLYAHLIGEVDGKPALFKGETIKRASEPQTDGLPIASPFEAMYPTNTSRFALGYVKSNAAVPMLGESSFGHVGSGGRLAFADVDSGITVGYICNNPLWEPTGPDARWMPWLEALRDIAERPA